MSVENQKQFLKHPKTYRFILGFIHVEKEKRKRGLEHRSPKSPTFSHAQMALSDAIFRDDQPISPVPLCTVDHQVLLSNLLQGRHISLGFSNAFFIFFGGEKS